MIPTVSYGVFYESRLTSTDTNVHIDRYERSHRPIRVFTSVDVDDFVNENNNYPHKKIIIHINR
jgi:hypothetical protein